MTAMQKHAWFNLLVIAVTLIAVVALYPSFGGKAAGGFGLLGLCGLGVLFYRQRGARAVTDERDVVINRRSTVAAYAVLWMAFVSATILARFVYGDSVPTLVIQNSVWVAFVILIGVQSIATLVQYGRTAADAA